jgi:glyoxylase-like metal-dependent hydrolase (beta-lactamase superfamily II)
VVTGDMVVSPVSYGFSAQPREWAATLQKLAALDFDILVPGHGDVRVARTTCINLER